MHYLTYSGNRNMKIRCNSYVYAYIYLTWICFSVFFIMPWFGKIFVLKFWAQLIWVHKNQSLTFNSFVHIYASLNSIPASLGNPRSDTIVPLPCSSPSLCYTPKSGPSTNSFIKFVNTNPPRHNPNTNFQAPTQLILYPLYTSAPNPLLCIPYTYPFHLSSDFLTNPLTQ